MNSLLPGWLGGGLAGNMLGGAVASVVVFVFVWLFSERIRRSAGEVAHAREEAAVLVERQRMARAMHYSVAQALFYLTVKLREVDASISREGPQQARKQLREAETTLAETYEQVRDVIDDLKRQADLEDFSKALRRAAELASGRLGLCLDCRVDDDLGVAPRHRPHLLAIVQEALSNARRHGHATRAVFQAVRHEGDLVLEVADDGGDFEPAAARESGGYGLTIMAERAQLAGGDLSLDSAPGRGARITVRLPDLAEEESLP